MTKCFGRLPVVFCLAYFLAITVEARDLHWSHLDVTARLDAEGNLNVSERHGMVFTGDWNGGERIFSVRDGQKLTLTRIARIDSDGSTTQLSEGDLGNVDAYAWSRQHASLEKQAS
jgi:hypothetical protein